MGRAWVAAIVGALVVTAATGSVRGAEDPLRELANRTYAVSLRGSIAFVAVTAGLRVLDVAAEGEPRELALLALPDSGNAVVHVGPHTVAVALGPAGVQLVDVSRPDQPRVVAAIDTDGAALDLAWDDEASTLWVADGHDGVVPIQWKEGRARVGNAIPTRSYARRVALARDAGASGALWVADDAAGVTVLELSEELAARPVGKLRLPAGRARDVAVREGRAYVAGGRGGLFVLDATRPEAPRVVARLPMPALARGVALDEGTLVAVACGRGGIVLARAEGSPEAAPVEIVTVKGAGSFTRAAFASLAKRPILMAAQDHKGLTLIDITRPADPTVLNPQ